MITVLMPSFHSAKLVKERILEINDDTEIIIIENSRNNNLKEELEKKHNNVKVVIPDENLGWGKAINLGINTLRLNLFYIFFIDAFFYKKKYEF